VIRQMAHVLHIELRDEHDFVQSVSLVLKHVQAEHD
jgi:hypothetical protein